MAWTLGIGIGVALAAQYISNLPYSVYPKSDFWLNSPGLVLIKLGVVLSILAVSSVWVKLGAARRWSLFRQLGTTSLLVYWVHIELVYGRWFGVWKNALSVPQVVAYTCCLIALMILLSVIRTRWKSLRDYFRALAFPEPERASGD